jgi:hypothetical protein
MWVEVACDVEASALLVEVAAWLVDVAAVCSAAVRRPRLRCRRRRWELMGAWERAFGNGWADTINLAL